NAGGSTLLGGNITTSGTQTYNDVVTLGSNAVLTTTNSAVNFAGTVDNATTTARALTVNAGSGAVTFGGAVGSDPTNGALGALIVNSTGLTSFGNVAAASLATNAGGSTLLGGNITTSGTQTYNDAVTLGSNAVLTTTNSAVNFAGTVDNATTTARALTVNAGTGAVTFGGAVGGDTTNGALDGLTTHSGSWSAGTLNIGSGGLSVTTTTGDITQGDKFVVIGLSDFNSGSHAITLDSANDFQGDVSATGTGVSITDVNDLKIAALNSGANGKVSLIAGGVLTLPVGSIDTGTANLTLTSNGGSLSTLGSLTGADISLTGLGLTLNNDVTATGTLSLFSGAAISQNAGVITAGTLTGSSAGATTLINLNHVGALGNFSAAGFNLINAQALAVTGTVDGGTSTALTTTVGDLAINGAVKGTTTTLTSAGAINEGAGGVITAGTLTGSSTGSTTLLQANQASALGAFTTGGDFAFNNAQSLTVSNAPSANGGAGNLTLTTTGASSDLTLASTLTGNTVSLGAGRNINQTAGAIHATTLTGSSVGSTTLNGANQIGALGNFSATGFNLINAQALAVTGTVDGGANTVLTTTAGDLAITGAVKGTTTTALTSAGAITEGAGGVITAGTLTGSSAGSTTLNGLNHIGTLGNFSAAGFSLVNAQALAVTGTVDGGASTTLTTTAGDLAINGAVKGTTTTTLTSAGAITEGAGGVITAGTLAGSSTGSTTLLQANQVGTLGAFTTGGDFAFNNAQSLTVNNAPSANGGAGNLTLTTSGAGSDLILASTLTGNTVSLGAGRNINQTAGAIYATILTGSSAGSTTLIGLNQIGALGNFSAAGFNLINAQALAVTGTVDGGTSTALTTTVGDLAINGAVKGSTTTTLTSAGAITEGAAGVITAGTLTGSSAGSTALNAANHVGNLGAFTTGGDFTFNNAQSLTVNNAPSANGGAGNLTLTTTGASSDLTLASTLTGNIVSLGAGRNINQTAGAIHATTLTGSSVGSTTLNGANLIGTLGSFTAANFVLTNAQSLAMTGTVDGGASTALKTTAGNLAINGAVKGTTTTLTSAGAITEGAGGVITAGTLTGSSTGSATLNGANHIGTLGSFTAANLALTNAQALAVTGPVNGGASTALKTTAGNLAINGAVKGTTTTLTSAGAITEGAGGVITAGTLTGSSAGSTALNAANHVGNLGAFTTGSDFAFNNAQSLTVNNAPSANGGAGNLTLTTTGASSDLTLASTLTGNTVSLGAGRNINQTTGTIHASTLTGSSVGSTTLAGANHVGTLGNFSAAGFNLINAQALAVTGPVDGGASTSLTTTAGNLAINGSVKGTTTTLISAGAITEGAGGSITANLLTGHSVGNTTLDGNNHINMLGSFSADFSLTNGQTLTVDGPLDGGPTVALTTTAGDLIINGAISGTATMLTSAGAIVEGAGGVITADTLSGSSAGSTSLLGANKVAALGAFTSGGDFAFNTIQTLTVNDAPSANGGAGNLTLTTSGAGSDLILANTLTGNTVGLVAGRNISQTAGAIHATTLTGSSTGSTTLTGANQIGTLGSFTAANFALTNAQGLVVTGAVDGGAGTTLKTTAGNLAINGAVKGATTTLTSAGAISEGAGGAITAGTLTGSSTGATTLTGTNRIGTLGSFTAATFSLSNAQALTVTGAVNGGSGTTLSTSAGDLAINGAVNGTTTTLTSAGAITEGAGGTITADTLTGSSSGAATLNGANRIGTLGSFTAANFALTNAQALAVTGPVNGGASTTLTTTAGDLAINGAISGTATTLNSAGAINEGAGGAITAGTLSGNAVGPTVLGSAVSPNKNMVDTLGNFTSLAGFSMTNDKTLTLASVAGSAFTVNAGTSPFYLSVAHGDLFQLGTAPVYDGVGVWGSTGRMGTGTNPIYVVGTGLQNIANVGLPPAYFYAVDSSGNLLPLGGGFAINVPTVSGAGSAQNGIHGDSYIDPSVITANYRSYGIVPSGVRLPPDQQSGCDPDQPDQAACQDPDALGMVMPWPNAPQ
ncbi:beta strand repeat-containing protein, partial [Rhodanobacter lindaniclasticus]